MRIIYSILISFITFCVDAQEINVVAPKTFVCTMQLIPLESDTLEFPDYEAEFPGGKEAMQKYLTDNIQFPDEALENQEQGNVVVEFTVEVDGSITNVSIIKGVSQTLDKETRRLIRGMPNWLPAEHKGKKITAVIRIPVEFRLY